MDDDDDDDMGISSGKPGANSNAASGQGESKVTEDKVSTVGRLRPSTRRVAWRAMYLLSC
jgi:hypothetical protein